ncbi:enoyl-CoA hydratase/isomerase family protein [Agrobacterium deltaense]|uniref:enoyl-CoA hydratase/isomerase family protein n=1 Tax=Agrobacterium deltaense TaxID=1183412 RepID=UPI003FCF5BB1
MSMMDDIIVTTGELVLSQVDGALGHIHLNRPRALNSLNPEMVQKIAEDVDALESNPSVKTLAITGEGRGLCAGGDIKLVWKLGQTDPEAALAFWADEYRLNARIASARKPWLAIMDGICMGGGAGLSVHGSHRVVTERTQFAMPETGIGFFPDVGMTWALGRAKKHLGFWIGLTGSTITPADTIAAGLADAMIPSASIPELLDELAAGRKVDDILATLRIDPGVSRLDEHSDLVDKVFSADTVEKILAALETSPSEFGRETFDRLSQLSPTSLVITLELLRAATSSESLEECLAREYTACSITLQQRDFYEGIRAAVIDKDRDPTWFPKRLIDVDKAAIHEAMRSRSSTVPRAHSRIAVDVQ